MKAGDYIHTTMQLYLDGNGRFGFRLLSLDERYADFKRRLAAAKAKRTS